MIQSGPDAWARAENVLGVRLDALGDILMTTPALRALKESRPGRRITLLTSPAGAAIAALVPEIDDVIVYESPWMKATPPRSNSRPDFVMIEHLRRARFDAAAIFTVYSQNPLPAALLCYLADIPLRLAHCRENPYQLLTDWVHEVEPERFIRHEVRRQLDLVAAIGARTADERMSLRVPEEARERVRQRLQQLGLDARHPWAVIHPGASAPSRRYPPEGFAAAARQLVRDRGWRIVFTGGRSEVELVEGIRAVMGAPSHSLAGQLELGELAALIAEAPILIANNTGPVHIAAAVGTPVVDLYALTNLQHTPWGIPSRVLNHDVPCKLCYKSICPEGHHDCLRLVRPEAIVQAACALWNETFDRRGSAPAPFLVPSLHST
ncbi:MAG: lipopolysaccharide heptosyltransferase II [Isosphaeraceae bacterium]|nr:lipopolysaccharide heptosyltransferase II [Isosphaeraceae bacterium]